MEKEITVVTAFFNIKRDNWGKFERTADQYLEYFFGWAKLENNLIVYVETEHLKNKIMDFRRSLGLADRTIVHLVDDFRDLDMELFSSIQKATENPIQQSARLFRKNPEVWNPDYDYVMLLKMWCVRDAVSRGETGDMAAWVDFGYNHGGDVLDIHSNFSFTWKYDFPDKICLFLIQELDNRPIFDIVCSMDTYVMGTVIVGAAHLWDEFWNLMRESMISLNDAGLTDDDQNIILMSYRKKPEIFQTYLSDWQMPLKQFGGDHLKVVPKLHKVSVPKRIYHSIRKFRDCFLYGWRIFVYMMHQKAH